MLKDFCLGLIAIVFFGIRMLLLSAFAVDTANDYLHENVVDFEPLLFPALNLVMWMCAVLLVRRRMEPRE